MTTDVRTTLAQRLALQPAATAMSDANSLRQCERVLDMLLTQRGDPFAEVERVLADDPRCVFGHCLRAALIVRADSLARRSTLAASIAAVEAACPDTDNPARRHATAARAWLEGDAAGAAVLYGAIITDWPRDVVALAVAHALDFHLGRRRVMRDRVAQVLPQWTAEVPGYASVLAMYAFALEENGQYRRAEKIARRALTLDPGHPGAVHAIAHVMEMQSRVHDGLVFLAAAAESVWGGDSGLAVHLAWHRALFHLAANDPKSALAIYDAQIATAGSSDMSALADGSALLWRVQIQDIDVGERWRLLSDRWAMNNLADIRILLRGACHDGVRRCRAHRSGDTPRPDAIEHQQQQRFGAAPGRCTRGAAQRSVPRLRQRQLWQMRRGA
jgi:tetratricopeptide (TPR) repeat protein